jgi:hypothetical protein
MTAEGTVGAPTCYYKTHPDKHLELDSYIQYVF